MTPTLSFKHCEHFPSLFGQTSIDPSRFITLGVFIGLTLFTLQSKYDFSGMGPFLFGALIALMMTGIIGIFIPFGRTMDLIFAIGGCLIFSGYVVYDTYMINKRLSPDEYIMGAISLYLEYVLSVSQPPIDPLLM